MDEKLVKNQNLTGSNQDSSANQEDTSEKNKVDSIKPDPVDGYFEINNDSKFYGASLTLYEEKFGGKNVTRNQVFLKLEALGITYGIDEEKIDYLINEKVYGKPVDIAKYKPPVDGVNGKINYLYEQKVENMPKEDEKGFVNYKDLGIIRNIKVGTVIGEITPPTDGEPGKNIKGEEIPQKKGAVIKAPMGENVALNGDGSKIIATADGNLKFAGGKFSVATVFTMQGDVDASTGNLEFIGDIVVRGEVQEGFKVSSLKSVTISGNVTGATVDAGGDIIIKKGCINSTVTSHGNVTMDFCESSKITCDGDLKADVFVTSEVYSGGELLVQGKTGAIMGGKYTCLKNLTANSIGSRSYVATQITVGDNAVMVGEKDDCNKKIEKLDFMILRCTQAIDFLNEKKKAIKLTPEREELLASSVKSRIMFNKDKKDLENRIKEIDVYLENKENLSITCKKELFPGTKIVINDFIFAVNDKYQYCRIYLGEDGIKTETL